MPPNIELLFGRVTFPPNIEFVFGLFTGLVCKGLKLKSRGLFFTGLTPKSIGVTFASFFIP